MKPNEKRSSLPVTQTLGEQGKDNRSVPSGKEAEPLEEKDAPSDHVKAVLQNALEMLQEAVNAHSYSGESNEELRRLCSEWQGSPEPTRKALQLLRWREALAAAVATSVGAETKSHSGLGFSQTPTSLETGGRNALNLQRADEYCQFEGKTIKLIDVPERAWGLDVYDNGTGARTGQTIGDVVKEARALQD